MLLMRRLGKVELLTLLRLVQGYDFPNCLIMEDLRGPLHGLLQYVSREELSARRKLGIPEVHVGLKRNRVLHLDQ